MTSTLHAAGIGRHRESVPPADNRAASSRIRGVGRAFMSILVGAVVILGLAGFALAALPLLGWQSVILATGSMSPGLPAGALVVERPIAASELAIGDIVTVDRGDRPPVTHRIIAIAPATGILSSREITLQGDANDDPDPRPYVVEKVGLVVAGFPWGGQAIVFLRTPLALGIITVIIALLVLRAWWPQTPTREVLEAEDDQG